MTAVSEYVYRKRWQLDRNHGIMRLIDAGPVRAHIEQLLALGVSARGIADAAGVSITAVCRLRDGQPVTKRSTSASLLAVTAETIRTRPLTSGFVLKLGSVRRVEALLAIGWRHEDITAAMRVAHPGVRTQSNLIKHQRGEWIARDTADAVTAAYERLAMTPGPSAITRRRARAAGYAPPLAWDEEDLDDPDARPGLAADDVDDDPAGGLIDEVVVLRRLGGEQVRMTRAERLEVVRRLHAAGLNDREISRRIGVPKELVYADRARTLGLPANASGGERHA